MHENNNLLSITTGSGLGIYSYIESGLSNEHFHVLIVGIIGGAGGIIGKLIIQKSILFFKKIFK
jgi:hypothetical protein